MRKFILLNKSATNSQTEGEIFVPLDNFTGAHPNADNELNLYFTPLVENTDTKGMNNFVATLTITNNKHKEVLEDITKELNELSDKVSYMSGRINGGNSSR